MFVFSIGTTCPINHILRWNHANSVWPRYLRSIMTLHYFHHRHTFILFCYYCSDFACFSWWSDDFTVIFKPLHRLIWFQSTVGPLFFCYQSFLKKLFIVRATSYLLLIYLRANVYSTFTTFWGSAQSVRTKM